ncbi:bifunctional hydroxymethylpyrimidine kinase/phosphomethylpyrimidine kinase [Solibaculum mannosilyticum]|uniref:Hydroxymethylpyrimidine/phosphomethylpyrimidine kinase n=1 Tax=Solibaculum mannosilyticum TaxID=2780922 RepID=A0A7I8D1A8_9FIRM|nr:bifunctional hydroxymethylpyrimidine kinase/phosphomethylpyrimidine kinase [Solibaculum mannosilyticum]BCI59775.1 hydroxymethylpyrimidine/phosphomethylpyrimidine kinase [Solibaculum mannosilyticum]
MKHVLTIAGSDCSGGAGVQADLKTMSAHRCFAMSVITAITAQNTQAVNDVLDIPPAMIEAQIDAIFTDIRVDAVKIGMVSVSDSIRAIAGKLRQYTPPFVVVDPVMVSKSGYDLLRPEAASALKELLLPLATIVTPNVPEAEKLAGMSIRSEDDIKEAAQRIYALGAKQVLIKGGHSDGQPTDWLFDGQKFTAFPGKRIDTPNTHGTGCTLSSAIASNLALGHPVEQAVELAKQYIQTAIEHSIPLGHGHGPVNHFYEYYGGEC